MSNTEKLYQEKEVYGNDGMYRIFSVLRLCLKREMYTEKLA